MLPSQSPSYILILTRTPPHPHPRYVRRGRCSHCWSARHTTLRSRGRSQRLSTATATVALRNHLLLLSPHPHPHQSYPSPNPNPNPNTGDFARITHYSLEIATCAPSGTYYPWVELWSGAGHGAPDFQSVVVERQAARDIRNGKPEAVTEARAFIKDRRSRLENAMKGSLADAASLEAEEGGGGILRPKAFSTPWKKEASVSSPSLSPPSPPKPSPALSPLSPVTLTPHYPILRPSPSPGKG